MQDIPKVYDPKKAEEKWYGFWVKQDFFKAKSDTRKKSYSIAIPPPNVTGILHMGHALNNTVQDILIRWKRMQGFESLWMPGTDHAGIATQNVVEKSLAKESTRRDDLGREEFLKKVWEWRDEYGSTIIKQLKKLGCSCDWGRERFTMDDGYSDAVLEVFTQLYKKKLIYRGNYIINWCPRCQTALSDEEAQHKDLDGVLYYIKYPIKGTDRHITVATTRPETMLGDVAVAVNPKDKRYKKLPVNTAILPIMNRELPIIFDEKVDINFGTGALKVTPAHDPTDFALGMTHGLMPLNVMNPDGTMNENAGDYKGLDRFECREVLVNDLRERKLFVKSEIHKHSVGHCYRCHTVVEPRLSKQWFVSMKPLAKPAIEAVKKGKIKFHPERWTKVYLEWMTNIRDWCISRQIWWGHRIPVWYCKWCRVEADSSTKPLGKDNNKEEKGIVVSKTKPAKCPDCGKTDMIQDEDVLDTWFSSWLWPFATFGWPDKKKEIEKDLKFFYPTDSLVTAQEIIFFWVARMIMAGCEFMGKIPFSDVYIHGTVRDDTGTKMSKSLGNVIDPLDIIEKFGCDALRFSIICITSAGQDVFLSEKRFETGRNFANKIWNASRFILMNLKKEAIDLEFKPNTKELSIIDKWILSQLNEAIEGVTKALKSYRFNDAANTMYEFFWHKFCDWYLEWAKPRMDEPVVQNIMRLVMDQSMRLLHPIMPFITEEVWQILPHEGTSVMVADWPGTDKKLIDKRCDKLVELIIEHIVAIRNVRATWGVEAGKKIEVSMRAGSSLAADLKTLQAQICRLGGIEKLTIGPGLKKTKHSAIALVAGGVESFVHLEDLIDFEKERARMNDKISEAQKFLGVAEGKLKNKKFMEKAPENIIEAQKTRKKELLEQLKKLRAGLEELK